MNGYPQTVVIRHRKENLKKCSLRGLESRNDLYFYTYPIDEVPSLEGGILLSMEGSVLSEDDSSKPLILVDGTWRYAARMEKNISVLSGLERRSLPSGFKSAYPRSQEDCVDPSRGLASVEALYLAYYFLKRPVEGLLEYYYWKDLFLKTNNLGDYKR